MCWPHIFSPDGTRIGVISEPEKAGNLVFGGEIRFDGQPARERRGRPVLQRHHHD
jgi:hypothetical protein